MSASIPVGTGCPGAIQSPESFLATISVVSDLAKIVNLGPLALAEARRRLGRAVKFAKDHGDPSAAEYFDSCLTKAMDEVERLLSNLSSPRSVTQAKSAIPELRKKFDNEMAEFEEGEVALAWGLLCIAWTETEEGIEVRDQCYQFCYLIFAGLQELAPLLKERLKAMDAHARHLFGSQTKPPPNDGDWVAQMASCPKCHEAAVAARPIASALADVSLKVDSLRTEFESQRMDNLSHVETVRSLTADVASLSTENKSLAALLQSTSTTVKTLSVQVEELSEMLTRLLDNKLTVPTKASPSTMSGRDNASIVNGKLTTGAQPTGNSEPSNAPEGGSSEAASTQGPSKDDPSGQGSDSNA